MKSVALTIALLAASPGLSAGSDAALALPSKSWGITVDLNGFDLEDEETRSDGEARKRVFSHKNGRYNLTLLIKPAPRGTSATDYRNERWERIQAGGPPEEDSRLWETEDRAFFQYFTEALFKGEPLHQKHIHTFLVYNGYRIAVHVSALHFRKKDQAWLDEFQSSIRITNDEGLESN